MIKKRLKLVKEKVINQIQNKTEDEIFQNMAKGDSSNLAWREIRMPVAYPMAALLDHMQMGVYSI